jgi:hypothetical protein
MYHAYVVALISQRHSLWCHRVTVDELYILPHVPLKDLEFVKDIPMLSAYTSPSLALKPSCHSHPPLEVACITLKNIFADSQSRTYPKFIRAVLSMFLREIQLMSLPMIDIRTAIVPTGLTLREHLLQNASLLVWTCFISESLPPDSAHCTLLLSSGCPS